METIEEGTDSTAALPSQGKKKRLIVNSEKKKKKKAINVVGYFCRFITLSIQTHRSPLNCFIEQ